MLRCKETENGKDFWLIIKSIFSNQQFVLILILIAVMAVFTLINPVFISVVNLTNILKVASIIGISAIGMSLVIILGGIDLSVGSILALGGAIGAGFLGLGFGAANPVRLPFWLSITIALLISAGLGAVNGITVAKYNVAPFAVTLGMMLFARGLTYVFNDIIVKGVEGTPITFMHPAFTFLGDGMLFGFLPTQMLIFILIAVIFNFILKSTRYGRNIYAIGGNIAIARLAGINVKATITVTYMLMGLFAGISGLVFVGRLSTASPLLGNGFELDLITAVVIGGTSMSGGRGSIAGTVIGVLLLGVLNNGLEIVHLPSFYQYLVKGAVLIIAVIIDKSMQEKRKMKE